MLASIGEDAVEIGIAVSGLEAAVFAVVHVAIAGRVAVAGAAGVEKSVVHIVEACCWIGVGFSIVEIVAGKSVVAAVDGFVVAAAAVVGHSAGVVAIGHQVAAIAGGSNAEVHDETVPKKSLVEIARMMVGALP